MRMRIRLNKCQTGLFQPSKVSLTLSVLKSLNMYLQLFSEIVKNSQKNCLQKYYM